MSKKKIMLLLSILLVLSIPTYASTYTSNTKTDCIGKSCKTEFYGGTQFIQEKDEWVSIDKASSLKDYFNFYYKERDSTLNVEVVDFNYTSITLSLSVNSDKISKDVPLKVYKETEKYDVSKDSINKTEIKSLEIIYNFKDDKETKIITIPYKFGYDIKFGTNSTTITLNETNAVLTDTHNAKWQASTNADTSVFLYQREYTGGNQQDYTLYRINLTGILPAGVAITTANLSYFVQTIENGCSNMWIGWYNLTEATYNYNSATTTYNTLNATSRDVYLNETNTTVSNPSDKNFYWNVTTFAKDAYSLGRNMSLMTVGLNTGNACDAVFKSKENTNTTSNRPQLVITYDNGGGLNATSTNITMNGGVGNFTYQYTTTAVNLTAYVNVTGLPIWIQVNETNVSTSTTSTTTNYVFPTGFWNVTSYTPGNATHSSSLTTIWGTITQVPTSMNLYLDGTQSNRTYSYNPTNVNSTGAINVTGLTVNISVNGTFKGTGTTSIEYLSSYETGLYNITSYYNGNSNYSASSKTYWLTITQASNPLTLSSNASWSVTYPAAVNITGNGNLTAANLYRNGTLISNPYVASLSIGAYNFTWNTSGNANYSSNSTSNILLVSALSVICNLITSWEGSNTTYNIYSNRTNASCVCNNPESGFNLYRNGVNVNSTENGQYKLLSVGPVYTHICNTSASENYSSATNTTNIQVLQGYPSINVTTNTTSNTSSAGVYVNMTCNKPGELNATLYNATSSIGNPYLFNTTGLLGLYNFTCNTTNNTNYTMGTTTYSHGVFSKRILLIDEDSGNEFTKFVNMTVLRAVTENGRVLWNFLANNTTSFYYAPNATESIMIEKQYVGSNDQLYVDIVTDITPEETIKVCVAGSQQFYEVILYSSSIRPVIVKNNFADCYVEAGYTRFAYSNAFMTKIYTKQDLYYVYLFNGTVQYLLTRLDGSSALAIALDVLEFNQKQITFSLIPEDLTVQRMSNETVKIYYRNEKEDSSQTTMNIYNGASLLYAYIENATPNDFYITFNFTAYGAGANSTLKVDAVISRTDGSTDTISRVFLTNGSYGILNPFVAIATAFLLMFFGLTMVASRYALGYFGIIIQLASLAVTAVAPATDLIRLTQVIISITLLYTIMTYREENLHIT